METLIQKNAQCHCHHLNFTSWYETATILAIILLLLLHSSIRKTTLFWKEFNVLMFSITRQFVPLLISIPASFFIAAIQCDKQSHHTNTYFMMLFHNFALPSFLYENGKYQANNYGARILRKLKCSIPQLLEKLQNPRGKLIDQFHKLRQLRCSNFFLKGGCDNNKRYFVCFNQINNCKVIQIYGYKRKFLKQEYGRMQKQQNRFLCSLSHEFNTPLNHIIASLELSESTDCSETKDMAAKISLSSAEQMLFKVQDLLDYASIEYGQFKENKTMFKTEELFNDLSKIYAIEANERKITLNFQSNKNYINILADFKRIKQVLSTLVQNSIKFTTSGGVTLQTNIDATSVAFSITDSGCGMDELAIKNLFIRTHQHLSYDCDGTPGPGDNGELFGLGLCIAQKICQKMGTTLRVVSKKNEGSTFSFVLPNCIVSKIYMTPLKYTRVNSQRKIQLRGHSYISVKAKLDKLKLLKKMSMNIEERSQTSEEENEIPEEFPMDLIPNSARRHTDYATSKFIPSKHLSNFGTCIASTNTTQKRKAGITIKEDIIKDSEDANMDQEFFKPSEEVLVVDDDAFNRMVVEKLFGIHNIKVLSASNGYDALKLIKESPHGNEKSFKLILMDINMPGMNGIRCSEEIISHWETNKMDPIPIIALTACCSDVEKSNCLSVGMCDFMNKPITNKSIRTLIEKYLE